MVKFLNKWLDLFGTWNEWKKGSKNLLHPREKEMNSFFFERDTNSLNWPSLMWLYNDIAHKTLIHRVSSVSLSTDADSLFAFEPLGIGSTDFQMWLIERHWQSYKTDADFFTHDDDETLKVKYAAKTIQLAIELDTQILLDWERERKKHAAHFNLKFCRYKCYRIHSLRKSSIKGERHENNSNEVERFNLAFACEKKQPIWMWCWNMDFNRKRIRCCFEIIFRNEKLYFYSMTETILGSSIPITSAIVPISINFIVK